MDSVMQMIKEGKGLLPLDERKTFNLAMNYGDDILKHSIVSCNKNWVPVKDRKPKEDDPVLVSIEDLNGFDNVKRTVRVGKWSSVLVGSSLDSYQHEWKICGENGENCYRRVTAWKPLDEPYMPEV